MTEQPSYSLDVSMSVPRCSPSKNSRTFCTSAQAPGRARTPAQPQAGKVRSCLACSLPAVPGPHLCAGAPLSCTGPQIQARLGAAGSPHLQGIMPSVWMSLHSRMVSRQ